MKYLGKAFLSLLVGLIVLAPSITFAATNFYTNVYGVKVHVPIKAEEVPKGASAKCKDSTYSFSRNHRGTCSGHGGVKTWLK